MAAEKTDIKFSIERFSEETSMRSDTQSAPFSTNSVLAGRIVSALPILFLLFDVSLKFMKPAIAVQTTLELGYPESSILTTGIILLACLILHLIPRTSVLGAILLTGYLGGAVATHFRIGNPLFSHTLFPIYVGVLIWGGLFLRDARLRALIPLRK
jgi:DoxX-like protein